MWNTPKAAQLLFTVRLQHELSIGWRRRERRACSGDGAAQATGLGEADREEARVPGAESRWERWIWEVSLGTSGIDCDLWAVGTC